MSLIPKKIDFSCLDEAEADISSASIEESRFEIGSQEYRDASMDTIITSSPISQRFLLQSPRKARRHITYSFKDINATESDNSVIPRTVFVPPSPTRLHTKSGPLPVDGCMHPPNTMPLSPPYKRVRALRLFDEPGTPKTIYEKSSGSEGLPTPSEIQRYRDQLFQAFHGDTPRPFPVSLLKKPVANVNPFSPDVLLGIRKRKRTINSVPTSPKSGNVSMHSSSDDSIHLGPLRENETEPESPVGVPVKRIALNESNISRYYQEFHELELIGRGEFGCVYKCINRLDGCLYAIKRSTKPVAGSADEVRALNEVYAHAVLGSHRHVVRYFSAWAEDNHMIIQNEFCGGGSLAEKLTKLQQEGANPPGLPESELRQVLLHVARGLHFIHQAGLVHLDIKPGNIFLSHEPHVVPIKLLDNSRCDASLEELELEEEAQEAACSSGDFKQHRDDVVYKIGDLGHVTCLDAPKVEEGDCRYLPSEILREDFSHLTKADIFSLGLTIYEAAGAGPLPKNGELWHAYRNGELPDLSYLSPGFNQVLKSMVHPNPSERPSALQLTNHPHVLPAVTRLTAREAELQAEVNKQRLHSEILQRQLQDANRLLMSNAIVQQAAKSNKRLVGLKTKRSLSTTTF